jgi:putative ABC transport system permease protein
MPFVDALRSAVTEIYRNQPIYSIRNMNEAIGKRLQAFQHYLMLLGVFATIAAVLALVDVYSLVAYGMGQRSQEIGVRRAVGACTAMSRRSATAHLPRCYLRYSAGVMPFKRK